jgi:hypothetical protein
VARKKDRAFLICPRWKEAADTSRIGASGMRTAIHINEKTLAAIKGGGPSLDQRSARHCWLRVRRQGRCSMSMRTSWTSAPLGRGELSGAAPAGVALVCGGTTLS